MRIWDVPRMRAGRLQRARKTPRTIKSETTSGETPSFTNFVGASAAPNQAPAPKPQRIPTSCNLRRRADSTAGESIFVFAGVEFTRGLSESNGGRPARRARLRL